MDITDICMLTDDWRTLTLNYRLYKQHIFYLYKKIIICFNNKLELRGGAGIGGRGGDVEGNCCEQVYFLCISCRCQCPPPVLYPNLTPQSSNRHVKFEINVIFWTLADINLFIYFNAAFYLNDSKKRFIVIPGNID